ncbi:hypothetical protein [uncultured Prevotella sp.]|jgi:hypothetical protein|nr:hypothetical protein [uncultured Prevotella sp.]MBW4770654.1 hypothetical protein [Prevotella jejuni]
MKMMEKVKRVYKQPTCGIVCTEIEALLDQVSGQHSNIGQGGSFENAKQALFTEEDEEENINEDWSSYTPWNN